MSLLRLMRRNPVYREFLMQYCVVRRCKQLEIIRIILAECAQGTVPSCWRWIKGSLHFERMALILQCNIRSGKKKTIG